MSPAWSYRERGREQAFVCMHKCGWVSFLPLDCTKEAGWVAQWLYIVTTVTHSTVFLHRTKVWKSFFRLWMREYCQNMNPSPWFLLSTIMRSWNFALDSDGKREAGEQVSPGCFPRALAASWMLTSWQYVDWPRTASHGSCHTCQHHQAIFRLSVIQLLHGKEV